MTPANVLGLFGAPDRESSLIAIARVIGLIQRRFAVSLKEIAEVAGCSTDTIENAAKGDKNLLSCETLGRLRFFFGDEELGCFEPWDRLCRPLVARQPLTAAERLDAIEHQIAAIRSEIDKDDGEAPHMRSVSNG